MNETTGSFVFLNTCIVSKAAPDWPVALIEKEFCRNFDSSLYGTFTPKVPQFDSEWDRVAQIQNYETKHFLQKKLTNWRTIAKSWTISRFRF